MNFNIDTGQMIKHAQVLQQVHRSAFPIAVRQALNGAAFDVKQRTMPEAADEVFVQRRANFFKANSRVEPAQGFDVNNMRATVGFVERGRMQSEDFAVSDLAAQEEGGEIGGRSFVPLDTARSGQQNSGNVLAKNRLQTLRQHKIIDAHKVRVMVKNTNPKGRNTHVRKRDPKQQFIRAAFKAKELYGDNAFVLGNRFAGGSRTLSRIDSINSNKKGKLKLRRTALYTFRPNRKINVARTNFMRRASMESGLELDKKFVDAAIKQLKKFQSYD